MSNWSKMPEIERDLGFRVSKQGIEMLDFLSDGTPVVRAVQPNLPKEDVAKLWQALFDMDKARELAKREKEVWSNKAFNEHERVESLEKRLEELTGATPPS